jgi:hypothetical protein
VASSHSEPRRWQLVLDVAGTPKQAFTVRSKPEADDVMASIRAIVRDLMARGGCRSLTLGVHVEGADCDHELGGAG